MRLVPISNETLVNPQHISHITVREEPTPNPDSRFAHSYPVYRITMYDGKWYDIAYKDDHLSEAYPWIPLRPLLNDLGITR